MKTNKVFDTPETIKKELCSIAIGRVKPLYGHFLAAIENKEVAPFLILNKDHDTETGITSYSMSDRRDNRQIK